MACYLIHFEEPFGHAEHYLGYAKDMHNLVLRLDHHRQGNGARLMAHVTKARIPWRVVRIWPEGTQDFERKLKNGGGSKHRYCPECGRPGTRGREFESVTGEEMAKLLRGTL